MQVNTRVAPPIALSFESGVIPEGMVALVESANQPHIVRMSRGRAVLGDLCLVSMDYGLQKLRLYPLTEEIRSVPVLVDPRRFRVVYVGLKRAWKHPLTGETAYKDGVSTDVNDENWILHMISSRILRKGEEYDGAMTEFVVQINTTPLGLTREVPPALLKDQVAYEYERYLFRTRSPYWE